LLPGAPARQLANDASGGAAVTPDIASPAPGTYSLIVKASTINNGTDFLDASYTLHVQAVATQPLVFDGGAATIVDQAPDGWRYFRVIVPTNALGWDVRDRQRRSLLDRIVTLAGYFLKKDFFIFFCMCLAALGILSYMTPVLAVGGTVTMISTIVRLLRRAKPEARPPRPELGAKAPSSAPR